MQLPASLIASTLWKISAIAASFVVTLIIGISSVTGGLRDNIRTISDDLASVRTDVTAIRHDITSVSTALQGSDKNNALDIMRSEQGLSQQIGQLRTDMASFTASVTSVSLKFDAMNKSIDGLSGQIEGMQKAFANRPADFDPDKLRAIVKEYGGQVIFLAPVPAANAEIRPK